jgi:formate hydrogenlyase transcriptional activator
MATNPTFPPQNDTHRYKAVVRISKAIAACREPQELASTLADEIGKVLQFDHLHIAVLKEDSTEIEYLWGKNGIPWPDLPMEELPTWHAVTSGDPQHTANWDTEERYPRYTQWAKKMGQGSGVRIPLTTPHRRLGVFTLVRDTVNPFGEEEISFLHLIGRVVAFALDDGLNLRRSQQRNERLKLLLNLTSRITSNLKFRELLREIAANILIFSAKLQARLPSPLKISELKDKLAQEKLYLEEEIRGDIDFEQIVGNSPALKRVLELVGTVAPNDSTVLLLGETGTGKELIARAIHDRSRRKDRTFVKLNCAAIPTGLLESELFGHEKGAFTGAITQKMGRLELADQGTLFLDEVGDIPIEIQPKLLRALQEREFERLGSTHTRKVNVRLVAATNRDLEKMIAAREFRSDLYYRLNVFPIRIPPLRERKPDIPLLVSYFVQKFAKQMQKKIESIPTAVMKALTAWEWPGNVRELENFVERAVILTRGSSLAAPLAELRKLRTDEPKSAVADQDDIARIVKETISALHGRSGAANDRTQKQRDQIVRALTEAKGRVGGADGAAARLRTNRTTLLARMKKFGINPHDYA